MHFIWTLFALLGLWLLLSGIYEPFLLGLGVLSCSVAAFLANRLRILRREDTQILLTVIRGLPAYLPWFLLEIVKSNLAVARLVWQPQLPIARQIIKIPADQRTALGLTIHANSITLTPGTLTLEAQNQQLEVHALSAAIAEDAMSGEMNRRINRLEGQR